jgi:transketolase
MQPAERDLANAIRALAMDAVQAANSGHPGMPMGMAEIALALWTKHLRHNPADPHWPNRDRFMLSNGHGSMLQYALLHLTGYDLPIEELKNFRQLHSKTPGHPEYGLTPGVETTTGPLGQGFANAVGMAIGERTLAAEFNRPGLDLVDHHTYVFMGDGCMMEGISHEAAALAGTLGLGKLIAFYDDNGISIDSEKGNIKSWYTDDVPKRFAAYGWQVVPNVDGHDVAAVHRAILKAKKETARPTLICCKTIIGKGAPHKANTGAAHGAALGKDEVAATREAIGWPYPAFEIPKEIYAAWNARRKGARLQREWKKVQEAYAAQNPGLAREFERRCLGALPADWADKRDAYIAQVAAKPENIATRKASQNAIEGYAPTLPELIGGSADLAPSNLTIWSGAKPVGNPASTDPVASPGGNYIYYGVREFGMTAIATGLALHGGHIPFTATFLTFSDYARNAIRMAALMKIRSIYVFTHDSVGLGEDGPTHQSVEHAASLRLIPHLEVWRPADDLETAIAWAVALERTDGPTALLLSRQNLPPQRNAVGQDLKAAAELVRRGGYVLSDGSNGSAASAVIIATGSEVQLAMAAQKQLAGEGIHARVVSMPCTEAFDRQDAAYRDFVLPPGQPRVAVEAGVTAGWYKYLGTAGGAVVGIDRFGESAPGPEVFKFLDITAEHVAEAVRKVLQ